MCGEMPRRYIWIIVVGVICFSDGSLSQNIEFVWVPEFSYSWKKSDRWSFNTKTSLFASASNFRRRATVDYLESALTFSYSLTVRTKLGGGYLFRHADLTGEGDRFEHRLIQQIAGVRYFGDSRLVHRMRLEQRFRLDRYATRGRYRLSYDWPLEGRKLDVGEQYAIVSNEFLGTLADWLSEPLFTGENRISAGIGWVLPARNKVDVRLEYRTGRLFTNDPPRHVILIRSAFYMSR